MSHLDASLFDRAAAYFASLQDRICAALEEVDGRATFRHDNWTRDANDVGPILGGNGRTRVMQDGAVFEKAGVNLSVVHGRFSPDFARSMPGEGVDFSATGLSLVLHPWNPHVPTVHMNYRRLSRGGTGWFGGGADLTPSYLVDDDARHFHDVHRRACAAHPAVADFAKFKAECDRYFYIPHRGESRGVGGIFFDYLAEQPEETFAFVQQAGDAFVDAYLPIVRANKDRPYTEAERNWQLLRRGRYVEFNLVVDRGTIFGLKTGGRIESILMSLPATACWTYDHHPERGSPEARLLEVLKTPRDW
jgi:coproporphyrinogen III oxidase